MTVSTYHQPTSGADIQALYAAFLALIIAHNAPCGCKPTDQHISDISRFSGAAVAAIMQAMADAAKTHGEQQH